MLRVALVVFWALTQTEPVRAEDSPGCAISITAAAYDGPSDRYPHGALGDPLEWTELRLQVTPAASCGRETTALVLTLPEALVFEDTAPRLADLDGDGLAEVITVESHQMNGARLAIYGAVSGSVVRIAATPYIGRRFRWLAPVGAADLDGDGAMELAYVDRPHLAKTLRVWRFLDGRLSEVASLEGLTNHGFGQTEILGGIRDCGSGPEIITADAGWQRIMATQLIEGRLSARVVLPGAEPAQFDAALACKD